MKRYHLLFFSCYIGFFMTVTASANARQKVYYYQIRIYDYQSAEQENRISRYLQLAYLPAMHRAGIAMVGVFEQVSQQDSDKQIYVFSAFPTLELLTGIADRLQQDATYNADGRDYLEADYGRPPYKRIETILLKAFPGMPVPATPVLSGSKATRVYELRSYESPTEQYNLNKVQMFNTGDEIGLFKRLNFNAVFYAEVIAGSHMPNLMYMTTFNSKEDREQHWNAFNNDPQWKALLVDPKYAHNVSHADVIFLRPLPFSDL